MGPSTRRAYWVLVSLLFACVVGALVVQAWITAVYLGALLANVVVSARVARYAARHGYFQGRADLLASMGEAQRRGLTTEEWVSGEAARDLAKINDPRWRP